MPRGKELAQLPKSNIAADAGTDKGIMNVDDTFGYAGGARPTPSHVQKEEKH
ncbi:MAG TPA: hypothetical protein VK190_05935 [Pseudoneobacillus sp.]|nr:hypothetical protein [Pseudoneobacillus sp.]